MIYFDLNTANSLLPWIKEKIKELRQTRLQIEEALVKGEKEALSEGARKIDKIIKEITSQGIIIRDPDLGIFDFPAVINGRPAYLCWKDGEEEISFWHYIEEGFAGRKKITGKEDILSYT
ncbi:MAG: DUF2203 domain-containing protein [Acidianus sp.]|jgi:hypothetical protein|nr:DUF2203 domain-containing protein [Acidianus sp.]